MRYTLCALLALIISCPLVQAVESPAASQALGRKFESLVEESMRDGVVPGLAAALIVDGKVVSAKGYGVTDAPGGERVTARTRFGIGSVTKTFTAAAILSLQEEGKVSLDDPASRYLPELKSARDPRAALLTIRHLMSGRGCVPDIFVGSDAGASALEQEARRLMADPRFDLKCVPGQGYVYPNFGMVLAGLIVQRAAGMSFEDYVEKRLFTQMGMKDSSARYWEPAALGTNRGHYRLTTGGTRVGEGVFGRSVGPTGMSSSSIQDMSIYVSTLLAGGVAPNGRRILSQAAVDELFKSNGEAKSEVAVVLSDIETDYGLGWEINRLGDQRFIAKGGSTGVMAAYVVLLPKQRSAIIWLTNLVDYAKLQIVLNGFELLAGKEPKPYQSWPAGSAAGEPEDSKLPAGLRRALPGTYETLEHDLGGFKITEREGQLLMSSVVGDLELVETSRGVRVKSDLTDFNGVEYTLKQTHGRLEIWEGGTKFAQRSLNSH